VGGPKHKQPAFKEIVRDLKKQPVATENADAWRDTSIAWRFGKCDVEGCTWSWSAVPSDELAQILTRLKELESRTWKEILLDKTNGSIEASHENIAAEAKARIADRYGDVDTLWKLRVDGPGRIWGARIGHVFHIMWWDSRHTVYPMPR